jgi:hypothetical protein
MRCSVLPVISMLNRMLKLILVAIPSFSINMLPRSNVCIVKARNSDDWIDREILRNLNLRVFHYLDRILDSLHADCTTGRYDGKDTMG